MLVYSQLPPSFFGELAGAPWSRRMSGFLQKDLRARSQQVAAHDQQVDWAESPRPVRLSASGAPSTTRRPVR
jgi:hypothetical protein